MPDDFGLLVCGDRPNRVRYPSPAVACDDLIKTIIVRTGSLWVMFVCDVQDSHSGYIISQSTELVREIKLSPLYSPLLYRGDLVGLDRPVSLVLLTAPSLRGDNPPSFGNLSKALRWRGPKEAIW